MQDVRQIVLGDNDQSIRLLHVATDLAEEQAGTKPYRTGHTVTNLLQHGPLDFMSQFPRHRNFALFSHQAARHFVYTCHQIPATTPEQRAMPPSLQHQAIKAHALSCEQTQLPVAPAGLHQLLAQTKDDRGATGKETSDFSLNLFELYLKSSMHSLEAI